MMDQRLLAYVLVAVGIVGLLSRLTQDAGWLWVALVAAAFLTIYARQKGYPFLVLGAILSGVALGILLEGNLHWHGGFLVSLGAGIYAIDIVAHRGTRWPRWLGTVLMALGVLVGLAEAGIFGSAGFGVALILFGAFLIWRGRTGARPTQGMAGGGAGGAPTGGIDGRTDGGIGHAREGGMPGGGMPGGTVDGGIGGAPEHRAGAAPDAWEARPATPGGAGAARDVGPDPDAGVGLPRDAADLLLDLRAWRRDTAAATGIPEPLVLTEATLEELARLAPMTREALRRVRGIGEVKLERYGDALLELIRRTGARHLP